MCDMDFGDDGGMDIGISEDLAGYEGTDDLCDSTSFDEMSDISGVDEAEAMDMDIEEYPSLSEFNGVTDIPDNIGELPETKETSECGEFSLLEDIPPVLDGVEQAGELADFSQLDDLSVEEMSEDAEQNEGEIKIQDIYPNVEAIDVSEQSEIMTSSDTTEQPEERHSNLETSDYETAPETLDTINPETSGEYVSTDNIYQDRWREFGEEFSDGSESEGWDSLSDVPFSGEEQTEIDVHDEAIDTSTIEDTNSELQELEINYDEIYEGLEQEELNRAFENINIDADPERLETSLESFQQQTWDNLTLDEQKESMSDLADYVMETVGFDNPPRIEYYNNPRNGDYGGYNPLDNTLRVNEYMLADSEEAADTIAHELWHAHQRECANNPRDVRDYQYQFNYENYITPEMGHEAYENQLIEAEARAFAQQFKGRIKEMTGRTI